MGLAGSGVWGVGEGIGEDGHDGGVLIQMPRVDFVKGVGGCVVVVEVEPAVLDGGEARHTFGCEAGDIFAGFRGIDECFRADGFEDLGHGAQPLAERGLAGVIDAGGVVAA